MRGQGGRRLVDNALHQLDGQQLARPAPLSNHRMTAQQAHNGYTSVLLALEETANRAE